MKGYRTIIWNVANAIVGTMALAETAYSIPDEWMPYWIAAYITGNVILRLVTTGPVGGRE